VAGDLWSVAEVSGTPTIGEGITCDAFPVVVEESVCKTTFGFLPRLSYAATASPFVPFQEDVETLSGSPEQPAFSPVTPSSVLGASPGVSVSARADVSALVRPSIALIPTLDVGISRVRGETAAFSFSGAAAATAVPCWMSHFPQSGPIDLSVEAVSDRVLSSISGVESSGISASKNVGGSQFALSCALISSAAGAASTAFSMSGEGLATEDLKTSLRLGERSQISASGAIFSSGSGAETSIFSVSDEGLATEDVKPSLSLGERSQIIPSEAILSNVVGVETSDFSASDERVVTDDLNPSSSLDETWPDSPSVLSVSDEGVSTRN
jgi:hypothetical protein